VCVVYSWSISAVNYKAVSVNYKAVSYWLLLKFCRNILNSVHTCFLGFLISVIIIMIIIIITFILYSLWIISTEG